MDCLFCKIGSKEADSEIVYEDDKTLAFLDINPVAPGHAVVIPKDHFENIISGDFKQVNEVFNSVKTVTKMIESAISPNGFNIGVNHGKHAGQMIDHLHVHIIPRFEGDGGGAMQTIVRNPPKQQTIEEIADLIRTQPQEKRPKEAVCTDDDVEEILRKAEELKKEDINNEKKELEEHYRKSWDDLRRP